MVAQVAPSHGRLPRTGMSQAALLYTEFKKWLAEATSNGAIGDGRTLL